MKVIYPQNIVDRSKNKRIKGGHQLISRINYPRIKDILDSNSQGFFNQQFDPKNPVQSLKKGLLFNRRISQDRKEEDINSRRLRQLQESEQESKKMLNCFMDCDIIGLEELPVSAKTSIHKKKDIKQTAQQSHNTSTRQKQSCYQLRLTRNKWFADATQYSSGDFKRLNIQLPQINSLTKGYFQNTYINQINLKSGLQKVLDPLSFSKTSYVTKKARIRGFRKVNQDNGVPQFLINALKDRTQTKRIHENQQVSITQQLSEIQKSSFLNAKARNMRRCGKSLEGDSTHWSLEASRVHPHEVSRLLKQFDSEMPSITASIVNES